MPIIPNDFGQHRLCLRPRIGRPDRETVEDRKAISIFVMKKEGVFGKLRIEAQYGFSSGGVSPKSICCGFAQLRKSVLVVCEIQRYSVPSIVRVLRK